MASTDLADAVMQDVVLLHAVGVRVVLCHGGGPEVSAVGRKLGIEPRFVDGLRVTDDATMRVAQMVIVPVPRVEWDEVEELPETERGAGGFGSSGV